MFGNMDPKPKQASGFFSKVNHHIFLQMEHNEPIEKSGLQHAAQVISSLYPIVGSLLEGKS